MKRRAKAGQETRLAGALAGLSDVVNNDCQECGFADAEVKAWRAGDPAEWEDLPEIMGTSPDGSTSTKDGTYSLPLEMGHYLVCVRGMNCFYIALEEEGTTTLNVRLVDGTSRAFIAAPSATKFTEMDAISR